MLYGSEVVGQATGHETNLKISCQAVKTTYRYCESRSKLQQSTVVPTCETLFLIVCDRLCVGRGGGLHVVIHRKTGAKGNAQKAKRATTGHRYSYRCTKETRSPLYGTERPRTHCITE